MKKGLAIFAILSLLMVVPFAFADDLCTIPGDFMVVLDVSGTMTGSRLAAAKTAANDFIDLLDDEITVPDPDRDLVGVVSFSTTSTLDQALTFTHVNAKSAVSALTAGGSTNVDSGLFKARTELATNGRVDTTQVIVLLADGAANRYTEDAVPPSCALVPTEANACTDAAIAQAQLAKDAGISIFTIGLGLQGTFAEEVMEDIASAPENYFPAATPDDLSDIYNTIAETVCTCGNGELDDGEECDLGDGNGPTSTCNEACMLTVCGDEIIQTPNGVGEDGPLDDGYEQCEFDDECTESFCSEQYDDSCTVDYQIIDYNGNGILDSLTVEDSAANTCADCGCSENAVDCSTTPPTPECSISACGAGCEDDNDCTAAPGGMCDLNTCGCTYPVCGDGVQEAGEECDLGVNNADDGLCNLNCELTYCGDDIIQMPNGLGLGGLTNEGYEVCDDGQLNSILAECTDECTLTYCGDGTVQQQNGEYSGGPADDGVEVCEFNNQCTDASCDETYNDFCDAGKLVEYNDNDLLDSTQVTDFAENTCSDCGCSDNSVDCSAPPTNSECSISECSAQCEDNQDCPERVGFIATCNTNSCGCEYREINTVVKDSKVADRMSNTNFGLGRYMMVNAKITNADRSYIGLDVNLLELDEVAEATLRIPVYQVGLNAKGSFVDAYYCHSHDFVETAITWNNQPFDEECVKADKAKVIVKTKQGSPETWHEFTLTDEVNLELDTGDGYFTIVLFHREEDTLSDNSKYVQYLTLQYPEKKYRPTLEIVTI